MNFMKAKDMEVYSNIKVATSAENDRYKYIECSLDTWDQTD